VSEDFQSSGDRNCEHEIDKIVTHQRNLGWVHASGGFYAANGIWEPEGGEVYSGQGAHGLSRGKLSGLSVDGTSDGYGCLGITFIDIPNSVNKCDCPEIGKIRTSRFKIISKSIFVSRKMGINDAGVFRGRKEAQRRHILTKTQ